MRVLGIGILLSVLLSGCGASAQDRARFTPGQTYVVVWGWQFEELLTVDVVAADGWLQVRDEEGLTWWVNTAQMLSVTLHEEVTPSRREKPK